ncbi:MAG: GldG family protein [Clostridia bacterium]|nr:GldG family protein [Clostridia bacterium]
MKLFKIKKVKNFKAGGVAVILAALVLAAVIALNLLVGAIPESARILDTSRDQIYTVGETTKAILDSLDRDVKIYFILQSGEDSDEIEKTLGLIEQYAGSSSRVSYEVIDPAVKPNFTKTYTDETVYSGSALVVCGEKCRVIPADEWFMYETTEGRMTYSEYRQMYEFYYMYYGQGIDATYIFTGETNLTSAISYVTSDANEKIYFLSGHGEQSITGTFSSYIDDANIDTDTLSLLTGDGAVPADCSLIIINYPKKDIDKSEADTLINYYNNGGAILLVTYVEYYQNGAEPNLASLAAACGMKSADGMVFEGSSRYYRSYQYNVIPSLSASAPEELWNDDGLTYALTYAHAIEEAEDFDGIFYPLLTTSSESYLKSDLDAVKTLEKEDGDTDGPFNVAAASEKGDGKFVWFPTPAIYDQSLDYGGNSTLFKAILSWTCSGSANETVSPKVISTSRLELTEASVSTWRAIFIGVIPVAALGAGFAVWYVRRRKR